MTAIGLFRGYEDGTFKPDKPVMQSEAVVVITKIAEATPEESEGGLKEDELADTPPWARESIRTAAKLGIVNLNRFHSAVQATRAQVAVWVAKALNLEPVETSDVPFKDRILISPEDLGYIMALYEAGIIKGTPDGKFNPNSAITRAELATIMEKILNNFAYEEQNQNSTTDKVRTKTPSAREGL
ncbi:MAG: Membrane protein [Thermoanaerobacterales bacterium 50_218]|nr:MAG: Membrane protein [Thermoanaerobacterales bacterium 50_218]HAA90135.1 hypothetical protein [Peptococcaceae bacterium]